MKENDPEKYAHVVMGQWADVAEGAVSTNVEYAPYVEFGTSKQRAQPYLRPAVRIVKPKIDNLVINEIRKAMKV